MYVSFLSKLPARMTDSEYECSCIAAIDGLIGLRFGRHCGISQPLEHTLIYSYMAWPKNALYLTVVHYGVQLKHQWHLSYSQPTLLTCIVAVTPVDVCLNANPWLRWQFTCSRLATTSPDQSLWLLLHIVLGWRGDSGCLAIVNPRQGLWICAIQHILCALKRFHAAGGTESNGANRARHEVLPYFGHQMRVSEHAYLSTSPPTLQSHHVVTIFINMSTVLGMLYDGRWYIACGLLALYLVNVLQDSRKLAHVKGPWITQFSDIWLLGVIFRQKSHHEFYDLKKKYGM